MLPAAIICDMDGLLLDTERLSELSFRRCCREFDLPFYPTLFAELTGQTSAAHLDILRHHLADISVSFDHRWKQIYHEMLADHVPIKPQIPEMLARFKDRNIQLAVATSSQTDHARNHLKHAGLIDFFSQISGSDLVDKGKPAPDIYLLTLDKLQLPASACIVLEDSNNGVKAGLASGMRTIHIPDRQIPLPEFADNALYVVADTPAKAEAFILSRPNPSQ